MSFGNIFVSIISIQVIFTICPVKSNVDKSSQEIFVGAENVFERLRQESQTHSTVPKIIKENGYPVETHVVAVASGYIVTLFRIPTGKTNTATPRKVVLLLHGNCADSGSWILNSVDKALAYRLADSGLDVWMMNDRGTKYSLEHKTLNYNKLAYWDFGFVTIGTDDHPIVYDYMLATSGQPDFYVISHSMGAAELLVSLVKHPKYISKIRTWFGIAPAVFLGNTTNKLFRKLSALNRIEEEILNKTFVGAMIPPQILPFLGPLGDLCSVALVARFICMALIEATFGADPLGVDYDMTPEIMAHVLSSTSTKKTFHAYQLMGSSEFEDYNYYQRNQEIYGSDRPPKFDLSGVTVPAVIYHAKDDNVVVPLDVQQLMENLPNVKEFKLLNLYKFNHIDFLLHTSINELMNDRIIEIIQKDLYHVP